MLSAMVSLVVESESLLFTIIVLRLLVAGGPIIIGSLFGREVQLHVHVGLYVCCIS